MKAYFNPSCSSIQYVPVPFLLAGAAVAAGMTVNKSFHDATKAKNASNDAIKAAEDQATQKALQASQEQERVSSARKALLDAPTSGFGPNVNLARSFLTSL